MSVIRQRSTFATIRAASMPAATNTKPTSTMSNDPPIENRVVTTETAAMATKNPRPIARTARQVAGSTGESRKTVTGWRERPAGVAGAGAVPAVIGPTLPFRATR